MSIPWHTSFEYWRETSTNPSSTNSPASPTPIAGAALAAALLCGVGALVALPGMGSAGSARDFLNAPIDTWLTFYNFGYSTFVTPKDGMDVTCGRASHSAWVRWIPMIIPASPTRSSRSALSKIRMAAAIEAVSGAAPATRRKPR